MWTEKGGTLSNNNAEKEYGLTQIEIREAINSGKLQYKMNWVHGNPYFKLLRHEVEKLALEKHGSGGLERKKLETQLGEINKNIRKSKRQTKKLEKEKLTLEQKLKSL